MLNANMIQKTLKRQSVILLIVSLILLCSVFAVGKAYCNTIVMAGSSYYQTLPGTYFIFDGIGRVDFKGLPIGPGNTNVIFKREADADLIGGSVTVEHEVVALSLVSVQPISIPAFPGVFWNVYLTLNPLEESTGMLTINGDENGGTFSSPSFGTYSKVSFEQVDGPGHFSLFTHSISNSDNNVWVPNPNSSSLIVSGSYPNSDVNLHTNTPPGNTYVDFFLNGVATSYFENDGNIIGEHILTLTLDEDEDDEDGDGIPDELDVCIGGDDFLDKDSDSVPNYCDNCPTVFNPEQTDINGDGYGDSCVSPNADISNDAIIGDNPVIGSGCEINKGVTIGNDARIGDNVVINKNSIIGNSVVIGDGTVINTNVIIGDNVVIGPNVTIGKNVVIGSNVQIGDNTFINKAVTIGDDVVIGAEVTIGRDAEILTGAVISDGMVVDKEEVIVKVSGTVSYEGTPLCAAVIANRQYMFSCADPNGEYELYVPLDETGHITLLAFVGGGLAPFKAIITPEQAVDFDIKMSPLTPGIPEITLTYQFDTSETSGWVKMSGEVKSEDGTPLCGMVLANGQYMWTCEDNLGGYDLEMPLDENNEVTVFVFSDGFQAYKDTISP